jgi:hypothetical protein
MDVTVNTTSLQRNRPSGVCVQWFGSYWIRLMLLGVKRRGFWAVHPVSTKRSVERSERVPVLVIILLDSCEEGKAR